MYPKIIINPQKYLYNLNHVSQVLKAHDLSLMVVTKVFAADQKLIDVVNSTSCEMIADSRIHHLKKIKTDKPKVLLRIAQKSEVDALVLYTDISLQSEYDTIKHIDKIAKKHQKIHKIILMFDIGDLREGIFYQSDYLMIISDIMNLKHVELIGIGTNVTCYGGVIPTRTTMEKLIDIKVNVESKLDIKLQLVSGGNSSLYEFILRDDYPKEINNVRMGELLILGKETAYGHHIEGMFDDVITLKAQVVEMKEKPTLPIGELGMNAFGEKVSFIDKGIVRRVIFALGRQDVDPEHLICPKGFNILGASSDHLICEVDRKQKLKKGDIITFKLTYGGILSVMNKKYLGRVYVDTL